MLATLISSWLVNETTNPVRAHWLKTLHNKATGEGTGDTCWQSRRNSVSWGTHNSSCWEHFKTHHTHHTLHITHPTNYTYTTQLTHHTPHYTHHTPHTTHTTHHTPHTPHILHTPHNSHTTHTTHHMHHTPHTPHTPHSLSHTPPITHPTHPTHTPQRITDILTLLKCWLTNLKFHRKLRSFSSPGTCCYDNNWDIFI